MPYQVHNMYHSVHTRAQRYSSPTHKGMKQFVVSQRRLLRSRPLMISDDELLENIESLKEQAKAGLLKVTLQDGREIDLDTLQPKFGLAADPITPEFRDDLVEFDKPHNPPAPSYRGEIAPPEEFEMPVPPPDAALESPVEEPDVGSQVIATAKKKK